MNPSASWSSIPSTLPTSLPSPHTHFDHVLLQITCDVLSREFSSLSVELQTALLEGMQTNLKILATQIPGLTENADLTSHRSAAKVYVFFVDWLWNRVENQQNAPAPSFTPRKKNTPSRTPPPPNSYRRFDASRSSQGLTDGRRRLEDLTGRIPVSRRCSAVIGPLCRFRTERDRSSNAGSLFSNGIPFPLLYNSNGSTETCCTGNALLETLGGAERHRDTREGL